MSLSIPVRFSSEFLEGPDAPLDFRRAMSGDCLVIDFGDATPHWRNRELALSLLSTLGPIVAATYPKDGPWSDLSVKLDADPGRTHGVGRNEFHVDLVDRSRTPDYIVLYCERPDPQGGGASTLADLWEAVDTLSQEHRDALEVDAYSYFADSNVNGVGEHLERFSIVPRDRSLPVRFTRKMEPHLRRSELVDTAMVDGRTAAEAFSALGGALDKVSASHRLTAGQMLVFRQTRLAHSREPLGPNQHEVPVEERRLLRQTYVTLT